MNKILVGLTVPAIQEQYDLLVPVTIEIAQLMKLLTEGIQEIYSGHYTPSALSLLTMKYPDMLLQPGKTLEDYGMADGSQLVLF